MIVGQKTEDRLSIGAGVSMYATVLDFYAGITTPTYNALVAGIPEDLLIVFILINGYEQSSYYAYQAALPRNVYKLIRGNYSVSLPTPPSYIDLLDGYPLDPRTIPNGEIVLKPTKSTAVEISYFRKNYLEPHPLFKSIDWVKTSIQLTQSVDYCIDLAGIVLGTLTVSSIDILTQILSYPISANNYPRSRYLEQNLDPLFAEWDSLFNAAMSPTPNLVGTIVGQVDKTYTGITYLRKSAANNNAWNNADLSANIDINFDDTHPMFKLDNDRAYDWHIAPQTEGIGSLTMDSPRTIEIHAALNAGKYAVNELDSTKNRFTNLGYLVEQVAKLLGLRLNANGEVDRKLEATYTRKIVNNDPQYHKDAFGTNCFGQHGMLIPHLTNSNGDDSYDIVYDYKDFILACFEHVNRSLGVQDGTELNIPNAVTGENDYYPNQLAVKLDMLSKITEVWQNSKEAHNLTNVIATEQRELMSGIGMPIAYRDLYTRYGTIAYLGHQSDKGSINTALTTIKLNLGIFIGAQLQPPVEKKNVFQKLVYGNT
jgi:hypothetical protein